MPGAAVQPVGDSPERGGDHETKRTAPRFCLEIRVARLPPEIRLPLARQALHYVWVHCLILLLTYGNSQSPKSGKLTKTR